MLLFWTHVSYVFNLRFIDSPNLYNQCEVGEAHPWHCIKHRRVSKGLHDKKRIRMSDKEKNGLRLMDNNYTYKYYNRD